MWFLGAGGFTITLSFEEFKVTYCHVSPNFIVAVGDNVKKGQIIGYVGPKYIYNLKGNPYKDANGIPTNGATTGCHFHLGIRVNRDIQKPSRFFLKFFI